MTGTHWVSEIKAEHFTPKVDIVVQNEISTGFYNIVCGAGLTSCFLVPLKRKILKLYLTLSRTLLLLVNQLEEFEYLCFTVLNCRGLKPSFDFVSHRVSRI
ncbi:uncharacterized protein LOC142175426 [Nicotiana tabacum]|uniref:Uncharacterized protein LOC142175426 n=2 Tax=Nicotiana TaxID=4085 RepID=A0AC58TM30_TOBAC|nr:PREDICTED: uncharacterized protein LOC104236312 [Nicotiana sylvestris]